MIESRQGPGAEAGSSEFKLYFVLYLSELRGVLEPHTEHTPGSLFRPDRHCACVKGQL